MTLYVKNAGLWKPAATKPFVKSGGVWKPNKQAFVRDGGLWKPYLAPELTFIGHVAMKADGTATYNFGNFTFPEDCLAIVAFTSIADNSRVVTAVNIGGVAATLHAIAPSSRNKGAIASLVVAAGTYAVQVVLGGSGGSFSSHSVGVWALTNYRSATPVGALANNATSNVLTSSLAFNWPRDGVAVYSSMINSNDVTVAWSSASADGGQVSERSTSHAAKRNTALAETPHTETITYTPSNQNVLVGASWS